MCVPAADAEEEEEGVGLMVLAEATAI